MQPLAAVYTFRIMSVAKVFMHGNSQAIRIPREYRVEGSEVEISRVGRVLLLRPKKLSYADALAAVTGIKGKLRRSQDADKEPKGARPCANPNQTRRWPPRARRT